MAVKLVGILNITPDSFSDGGKYDNKESALAQTERLIIDGADIIDIGAESTRPNATLITGNQEWQRLKYLLPDIIALVHKNKKQVSLDTRNSRTAEKALDLGVDIINDVSALTDPNMGKIINIYDRPIIINHNLGLPANPNVVLPDNQNVIDIIKKWGHDKIIELENNYKIKRKNIIFDVGIGFGKTAQQSLDIIDNISAFNDLGVEIYVGHSRKSFLNIYNPKDIATKDCLTAYFSSKIAKYTDYIRVHNVSLTKKFISLAKQNDCYEMQDIAQNYGIDLEKI